MDQSRSKLTADFRSLPPEYQHLLQQAQDQHQIRLAPSKPWLGAMVEANLELIRSSLSEADWAAAQKQGQAMTLEQALTFAPE